MFNKNFIQCCYFVRSEYLNADDSPCYLNSIAAYESRNGKLKSAEKLLFADLFKIMDLITNQFHIKDNSDLAIQYDYSRIKIKIPDNIGLNETPISEYGAEEIRKLLYSLKNTSQRRPIIDGAKVNYTLISIDNSHRTQFIQDLEKILPKIKHGLN